MAKQLLRRGSQALVWPVALAVAVLCYAMCALAFVEANYVAVERYAVSAVPRITSTKAFSSETPRVRVLSRFDAVGGRGIEVRTFQPLVADAPLPPGLTKWPAPGEFLVSPDLMDHVSDISAIWGTYAGVLDADALASDHPRLVYLNSLVPLSEKRDASGFGAEYGRRSLLNESKIPRGLALGGVGFAVLIPAVLVLLSCLSRVRSRSFRQLRVLEVLGADPARLQREAVVQLLPSLAVGAGLGMLPFVAFGVPIPLPWAGFVVRPVDVRAVAGVVVGAWIVAVLLSVFLAWWSCRPAERLDARQRRLAPGPLSWIAAVVGVVGVVVCAQQSYAAGEVAVRGGADNTVPWLAGGMLIGIATMRAMADCVLWLAGSLLIAWGRRSSRGAALLIGRSLTRHRMMAQMAAVAGSLVLLTGVAVTWAYSGSMPAVQAQRLIDQIDGRFAVVNSSGKAHNAQRVVEAFPAGTESIRVHSFMTDPPGEAPRRTAVLVGSASALQHFALTPGASLTKKDIDPSLAEQFLAGFEDQEPVPVVIGPLVGDDERIRQEVKDMSAAAAQGKTSSVSDKYVVARHDGGRVDINGLKKAVGSVGEYYWRVEYGGEDWVSGANTLVHTLRWIPWFSVLGSALLLIALWTRASQAQRRQALMMAPVDAVFAGRPRGPVVTMATLGITAITAALIGGGSAGLLSRLADKDLSISGGGPQVVLVTTCAVFVLILTVGIPASLRQLRFTRTWTLGNADD